MRLTKRQLKRIIREEYSRLKRRGLIKEAYMQPMTQVYIDFELMDGGEWSCEVPEMILNQLSDLMAAEYGEYGELDPDQIEQNEMDLIDTMQELYAQCEEIAFDQGETEEGLGAPMACTHEWLWNKINKMAQMF